MQVTDTVITLTPTEIADKTDRQTLLAAIASVAAQETVTPEYGWVDVHGVAFDVVQERSSGDYFSVRTYHLLGIHLKVESDYRTIYQRRVMLKAGTLDIAKLRAAYAQCKVTVEESAARDARIAQAAATRQAEIAEAARRAALYPEMLEALTIMASWAEREHWDVRATDALGLAFRQARAVIARCGGAS